MSEATDMVALYITAEKKVLAGQAYSIDGRSVTRADLPSIRQGRKEWEAKVRAESAKSSGGSSFFSVADFS